MVNMDGLKSNISSNTTTNDTKADPFTGLSFKVGVAENKNAIYRNKMEDVHTYIANFAERIDWGYFAIFDGHAGKDSARWCGNNLHSLLEQEIYHYEDSSAPNSNEYDMRDSLYKSFLKADQLIVEDGSGSSGCTAAVAVLRWETDEEAPEESLDYSAASKLEEKEKPEESSDSAASPSKTKFDFVPKKHHKRVLYTSNVGDARIILYRNLKPQRLSYDHKASDVNEANRIREKGGLIMKNRVNGVLAVTRSLGDSYMKDLVVGDPFTTCTEITAEDEFMILACDGVWDVISDLHACQFVAKLFEEDPDMDPQNAAKKLCQLAMDNSTTDNVTVMIVKFDEGVFKV